ncbi:MAG TPA: MerR family transcriptional regulator [Candidimonas sp.]|nr:MerR family transcriptional regulator [Candidimonas sp.]
MSPTNLTISRVAQLAGVNIETIRYYQRLGLLAQPDKPSRGYRRYSAQTIEDIFFIKRAQGLGFTLKEISTVFQPGITGACNDISALTASKVSLLEIKLTELTKLKNTLTALLGQCNICRDQGAQACVILQALHD